MLVLGLAVPVKAVVKSAPVIIELMAVSTILGLYIYDNYVFDWSG
jgi:hypothetical protein